MTNEIGIVAGSIAGMILFLVILYLFLFLPGLVARLICRNVEEKRLANFTALFMTILVFIKTDTHSFADPFFEGMGEVNLNVLKWILILQFCVIFAISRYLARAGIDLGNRVLRIINKKKPNQSIEATLTTPVD